MLDELLKKLTIICMTRVVAALAQKDDIDNA